MPVAFGQPALVGGAYYVVPIEGFVHNDRIERPDHSNGDHKKMLYYLSMLSKMLIKGRTLDVLASAAERRQKLPVTAGKKTGSSRGVLQRFRLEAAESRRLHVQNF